MVVDHLAADLTRLGGRYRRTGSIGCGPRSSFVGMDAEDFSPSRSMVDEVSSSAPRYISAAIPGGADGLAIEAVPLLS